eukprot:scaffold2355_cov382-Prasinococcus_capsulatus_cf.AAC.13
MAVPGDRTQSTRVSRAAEIREARPAPRAGMELISPYMAALSACSRRPDTQWACQQAHAIVTIPAYSVGDAGCADRP